MTRSELLEWFYRRRIGASAATILEKFGPNVQDALQGLMELGAVFEYSYGYTWAGHRIQMYGVTERWKKGFIVSVLSQGRDG